MAGAHGYWWSAPVTKPEWEKFFSWSIRAKARKLNLPEIRAPGNARIILETAKEGRLVLSNIEKFELEQVAASK